MTNNKKSHAGWLKGHFHEKSLLDYHCELYNLGPLTYFNFVKSSNEELRLYKI
jgi:hypothetical protein